MLPIIRNFLISFCGIIFFSACIRLPTELSHLGTTPDERVVCHWVEVGYSSLQSLTQGLSWIKNQKEIQIHQTRIFETEYGCQKGYGVDFEYRCFGVGATTLVSPLFDDSFSPQKMSQKHQIKNIFLPLSGEQETVAQAYTYLGFDRKNSNQKGLELLVNLAGILHPFQKAQTGVVSSKSLLEVGRVERQGSEKQKEFILASKITSAIEQALKQKIDWKNTTQALSHASNLALKIVTYNLNSFPEPRFHYPERVNQALHQLESFDVVLFQEVFSKKARAMIKEKWGHAQSSHPYLVEGISGYFGNLEKAGDGLIIASRYPIVTSSQEALSFSQCVGRFQDCLVEKGILHIQIQIPQGPILDIFTTHLQANISPEENEQARKVRELQLKEIRSLIERKSISGNAAILTGDLNLSLVAPELKSFLEDIDYRSVFNTPDSSQIDHVFIKKGHFWDYEVKDIKVFELASEVKDLDGKTIPISDHNALGVEIQWIPKGCQR